MKAARTSTLVGIGIVALLSFVVVSAFLQFKTATATINNAGNVCSQADVIAAEKGVPSFNFSQYPLPQGIPAIVARVNGQAISSGELESQVQVNLENHKLALSQLPPNAPADLRIPLTTSVPKIRYDALNTLIEEDLLFQEGVKSGKSVSTMSAQLYLQRIATTLRKEPQTSHAYAQFMAYLCVNNLSETNFVTNSTLIGIYQKSLTIAAVRDRFQQTLSPDILSRPDQVNTLMEEYVQNLRKSAKIQIYVPDAFLADE